MSTDMAAPIIVEDSDEAPPTGVHIIRGAHDMTDRELLEEVVTNQRLLIQQIGEVTATFSSIHEQVAAGGIGGLMKALMGRG